MSMREILNHNLWALRQIHRSSPGFIAFSLISAVYFAVSEFIIGTWLLQYILNRFQKGNAKPSELILVILAVYMGNLLFRELHSLLRNFVIPKMRTRITTNITLSLFDKSISADLACYETPDFYDKYVKAMDEAAGRIFSVLDTLSNLFDVIITVLANGILLFTIDWGLVIFIIFPILFGLLRKKELEVYYRYVAEQKPIDRRKKYIRRTFYLNEYAKEMRLTDMQDSQIHNFRTLYGDYKKVLRKHGPLRTFLGFIGEFSGDAFIVYLSPLQISRRGHS